QRKRISLGTKNEKAARKALHDLEYKYALGTFDPWKDAVSSKLTLKNASAQFLARQRTAGRGEDTIDAYRRLLTRLEESLPPGYLLTDVQSEDIERFIDARDLRPASVRNYYRHFRA